MKRSMTFPSKILRTKKRLSDHRPAMVTVSLAFFALVTVLTFAMRTVSIPAQYGVVGAEMPVVPATVDDPAFHRFRETAHQTLTKSTPAVVLTTEAFYFGDLAAFTSNFEDVRDKFIIRHVEGEPQLTTLIDTMNQWLTDRAARTQVPLDHMLVFVPTGDIPMPIVIQVLAGLKKSPQFERVILGGGLM